MKLRHFLVGALTLLTLSSCNSKDAKPLAQQSPQQQTQAVASPEAPAASVEGDVAVDESAQEDLVAADYSEDGEYPEGEYPNEGYDNGGPPNYQGQGGPQNGSQSAPQGKPVDVNLIIKTVQMGMQTCEQRMEMSRNTYAMAQQSGDQRVMQMLDSQMQQHRAMYSELQAVSQNPQAYTNEQSALQLIGRIQEYDYRSQTGDQRPTDQIQGELAQYRQKLAFNATPQGQAAFQNQLSSDASDQRAYQDRMTAAHNGRMNDIQASGAAHQNRMNGLQSGFQAHNDAWAKNDHIQSEGMDQYIHSINGQYEYQNPNNGDRYWVDGGVQNPAVINPDGSQTELYQYNPSSNY